MTISVKSIGPRILYPGRQRRRPASDAPRQPHIRIGMWVRVDHSCGVSGCLKHAYWGRYLYLGPIVAKRKGRWLVECRFGMGRIWASRDEMYVRDLDGRYWDVPLLAQP
jgi:hypothetical protein